MNLSVLPESYVNREQAFIKHTLLKSYLQKLFRIIGAGSRSRSIEICYVDCFAGPWGDESEGMEGTSIAISLQMLEACRIELAKLNVNATMRALFIEKNRHAYGRLEAYLKSFAPTEIQADCRHGDFVALRSDILKWAGSEAFAFFFVDPKGWKEAGIETLRPLLVRPRSEFLINFVYNFVNRTMSIPTLQKEMVDLIGEKIELDGLSPEEREESILSTYRTNLKKCLPQNGQRFQGRSAYVRVLHPTDDRTWYHLVYLTTHPKGIHEFMNISDSIALVQQRVRIGTKVAKQDEQVGTADMFGIENCDGGESVGRAIESEVDQFWLNYLANGPRYVGLSEFADILEDTDWFPDDLQKSLARLIASNLIRNQNAESKRPKKPLHFERGNVDCLERVTH